MTEDEALAKSPQELAALSVDTAIVQALLPVLYSIIDRLLLGYDGKEKALVIEARRMLPKGYKNSFEKEKNT